MIHRRNVAVAYVLTIPIFLGVLFVELGALYKLNAAEGEVIKAISASHGLDDLAAELRAAEKAAQRYVVSGSDDSRLAYGNAASRVNGALDQLEQEAKGDPEVQSPKAQANLRQLRGATTARLETLDRAMSARSTRPTVRANPAEEMRQSDAEARIEEIIAGMRANEQSQAEGEQANAARSAASANTLVKYAGVLTIWMIGVAGLLLFHDDRAGFRGRIEQPLHTDILESLPMGVCLASESGVILYANPAAESSFGYRPGELVARNVELLQEPTEGGSDSRIAEILAQMFGHEIWSGELSLRTREGEIVRPDSWISSIRVGGKDCRLLVHRAAESGSTQQHGNAAGVFRSAREAVRGTASLPGALDPDGPAPTRPPGSEPIGARGPSK
jgi:PAS domain S-box-containing protein